MKIGVAVTVHNRFDVTNQTLSRWRSMLPRGAVLYVVDDGSNEPYPRADFRFEESVGIPRAKNKCLELLEDAGVTDAFLVDNDVWPTDKSWWRPYTDSSEPHLSYQFLDRTGPVKLHDMAEVYRGDKHVAYTGQRGCVLYYHLPTVLPQVGGFDPVFGRGLYEHSDLADRIHAAGLTTWRYADVAGSDRLWHSLDEHGGNGHERTIPRSEIRELAEINRKIYEDRARSRQVNFVPYRDDTGGVWDVVITSLLTKHPDPQRGVKWEPDPNILSGWLESMERGGWDGIVLADELKKLPKGYSSAKVVQVESSTMNVYYQRWLHIYQYLRDNPGIRWVWCTDGSDVEVLRDPFEGMTFGQLYVGEEPSSIGTQWMRDSHPSPILQKFMHEYRTYRLLNAGVVGGDRTTIMSLAHRIIMGYQDVETERFKSKLTIKPDVGDMAMFNLAAYELFGSRLNHGPEITTEFKAYKDNGTARFRHK